MFNKTDNEKLKIDKTNKYISYYHRQNTEKHSESSIRFSFQQHSLQIILSGTTPHKWINYNYPSGLWMNVYSKISIIVYSKNVEVCTPF